MIKPVSHEFPVIGEIKMNDASQNIPPLFRGDNRYRTGPRGESNHLELYSSSGLFSNLIFRGMPREVELLGVTKAIAKHVSGWNKSHFLSFSANRERAVYWASGGGQKQLSPVYNGTFDALVISFEKNSLKNIENRGPGIFLGNQDFVIEQQFTNVPTIRNEFHHEIWIIDVVTVLEDHQIKTNEDFTAELALARGDQEWLIFPYDPMPDGQGRSAQLRSELISVEEFQYDEP
jgi:hypothetical protein